VFSLTNWPGLDEAKFTLRKTRIFLRDKAEAQGAQKEETARDVGCHAEADARGTKAISRTNIFSHARSLKFPVGHWLS
jgi:hypothetical protein